MNLIPQAMDHLVSASFTGTMAQDTTPTPPLVLVTGGTGTTGRRVVQRLEKLGVAHRIGSRNVELPFDWNAPSTWGPVLNGVTSIYLSYYPDIAAPEAAATIMNFTDLANTVGVQRVVLLSGRGEEEAQRCERIVQHSGIDWAVVRASWFCQNFSENFLLDGVLDGDIVLPAGDVEEPFVDAEDIADVAVAALTGRAPLGQVYEVTGPRLLTFAEATAAISGAIGRDVHYTPVTLGDYRSGALSHGVPTELVDVLCELFGRVLDGRNAHLSDGVQRALGRPPRDFRDYAADTAATGVWSTVNQGAR